MFILGRQLKFLLILMLDNLSTFVSLNSILFLYSKLKFLSLLFKNFTKVITLILEQDVR